MAVFMATPPYSARQGNDTAFSALSDRTRRGILERLGRGEATISGLAESFRMTLTGMKKHMQILEDAGMVTTEKMGRVRYCGLGPNRLDLETEWSEKYRRMLEARLDSLGHYLERTKGAERGPRPGHQDPESGLRPW